MLLAAALIAGAPAAVAQSCTFSHAPINFGSMTLISGAAVNVVGRFSMSCSGIAGRSIYICSHLGAGSGGVIAGTGQRRYMTGTTGKIDFAIYKNAALTSFWGSSFWGLPPTAATQVLTLGATGTATASMTVYGRVLLYQDGAAAGAYTSTFTGADAWVTYAYDATSCEQVGTANAVAAPLQVTGTVLKACKVSVADMNFGTASLLANGVDAQATISVTCSRGTPFAIKLGGGLSAATDPLARKMRQTTGDLVTYAIYRDSARTLPWGNLDTNDHNVASATGVTQNFNSYGRVPAQKAKPGTYTDTVLVEVVY